MKTLLALLLLIPSLSWGEKLNFDSKIISTDIIGKWQEDEVKYTYARGIIDGLVEYRDHLSINSGFRVFCFKEKDISSDELLSFIDIWYYKTLKEEKGVYKYTVDDWEYRTVAIYALGTYFDCD